MLLFADRERLARGQSKKAVNDVAIRRPERLVCGQSKDAVNGDDKQLTE